MKASFVLLAVGNLALMTLTAAIGYTVDGEIGFLRHFLLGVMTSLFTCFVHTLAFTYFVVQDKIIRRAVELHGLDVSIAKNVLAFKTRAFRLGIIGILTMLVAISLGAAIEVNLSPSAHQTASFVALGANALIFSRQYTLLQRYGRLFHRALGEA